MNDTTTLILLAGGKGHRFGGDLPKQFQSLSGKPVALHSFDLFLTLPQIVEIVVVCDPDYKTLFAHSPIPVRFAPPGKTRQQSVYHAFSTSSKTSALTLTHDSARPLISREEVETLYSNIKNHIAVALATKVTYTIKECDENALVIKTIPRENLWEIHTPQLMDTALLKKAIEWAHIADIQATDDLSLIEQYGECVKLIPTDREQIKITYPHDFKRAEHALDLS